MTRNGYNRREFLAASSLALVALHGGAERAIALPVRSSRPVHTFGPSIVAPDQLRALARAAIEAATRAGATYADIRIADRRELELQSAVPLPQSTILRMTYGYGLRVLVDGAWAFAAGADPSVDALERAAKAAVSTARGVSKVARTEWPMVAAPAVRDEWATPITIDPFTVSPDDHIFIMGALGEAAKRGGTGATVRVTWTAETRVFASSDNALITQRLSNVRPTIRVGAWDPLRNLTAPLIVTDVEPKSAGFEVLLSDTLQERIKARAEESRRFLELPTGTIDVGRYTVTFDGTSLGALACATLVPALSLERALGYEQNEGGTSCLAPIDEILGQPLFAPMLRLVADRSVPQWGAAKYDDEGVAAASCPLIEEGRVVDYLGTRATQAALGAWYAKRGRLMRTPGTALSGVATQAPKGGSAYATIAPGAGTLSLGDLAKQMGDGLMVRSVEWVSSDPQLSGAATTPGMLFEVKNGRIVRRILGAGLQISTKKFWRAMGAVGDASTVEAYVRDEYRGVPWSVRTQVVRAPAALMTDVNIVQTSRRLT